MRNILKICMLCICLGITSLAMAQSNKITGTVIDEKKAPVPYCNIVLKSADDSTFVTGCVTNDAGQYTLSANSGNYILHIYYIGYSEQKQALNVKSDIKLNPITLSETTVELKELVVEGKRKVSQTGIDTYYLNESPRTMGRNALEVISLAAGVSVDYKNGIKIYGKGGVRVMINNRMVELKGRELNAYLANIRGEDIATLKVDRTANAAYDADVIGGVIIIKMKKRQDNGYNASVGIEADSQKFSYLGCSPDISFNIKTGKFNLYGNAAYSTIGNRDFNGEESYYKGNNAGISTQTGVNTKIPRNDSYFRLGTVYDINEKHSIGVDMDAAFEDEKERSNTPSSVTDKNGRKDYFVDYLTPATLNKYNAAFNYTWNINETGSQLNIGTDYYYQTQDTHDDNMMTCLQDSSFYRRILGTISYNRSIFTLGADLKWVFNPNLTLNTGLKFNKTIMKDYLQYWNANDRQSAIAVDKENTDNMKYKENIIAGFINGTFIINKWTITAGVRYEQTEKKTESLNFVEKNINVTDHNFFPMLNITYDIDKEHGHHITLNFRSSITRPTFQQLVPYITQQNLYSYIKGNPNLKPSYYYSAGLDLLLFNAFYLGTSYSINKDNIELIIKPRSSDGLIMDGSDDNIKRVSSFALQAYVPIPVSKTIYFGLAMNGARKFRSMYYGVSDNIWQFSGQLEANLTLPAGFSFETTFSYINREFYGNMVLKDFYSLNLALRKTFLNKRLQVSFNGTNILGRKKTLTIDDEYIHRNIVMDSSDEVSKFTLSVRYNFNSSKQVKTKKVKAYNTEERSR